MGSLQTLKAWILFLVAVVVTVTISVNYPILSRMTTFHVAQRPTRLDTGPRKLPGTRTPADSTKGFPPASSVGESQGQFSKRLTPLRSPPLKAVSIGLHEDNGTVGRPRNSPSEGEGYPHITDRSNTGADIDVFTNILARRLKAVKEKPQALQPACDSQATVANSCRGPGKCLRMTRPTDVRSRVAQLVEPQKLRIGKGSLEIIQEMRQRVKGHYDVIIATAASSNHYLESQAMIQNLHENVFPWLKNFTFLYYDIGLTEAQRRAMIKYCKCQVLDYPFEKFPPIMRHATCYTWKPVIIKAHYHQTNLLLWADASMRFPYDSSHLQALMEQTRQRGVQVHGAYHVGAPFYTNRTMYHFFGDEPCMYLGMTHGQPSFLGLARDPFVEKVILEPWVACAMDTRCMCLTPGKGPTKQGCKRTKLVARDFNNRNNTGTLEYGLCHLFDQSAISLIIHKLYQEHYRHITPHLGQFHIHTMRGDRVAYFPEQEISDKEITDKEISDKEIAD